MAGEHLMMVVLMVVGVVTVLGVVVLAAIEVKRMSDGRPPILGRRDGEENS
jgi:hypothetical protein